MISLRSALVAFFACLGALTAPPRAQASQVTVTHYGTLMYGLPMAVALDRGFFREEGVNIPAILTAPGGGTAVRNALASTIPYGEAGLAPIVAAKKAGADLVIVNVSVRAANDSAWVVATDSPIRTLDDLRGKTVTFTQPKSGSEADIRMVLRARGLERDVTLVASGGMREGFTMIDVGVAVASPSVEPITTMSARRYRVLFRSSDILPPYTQTVGFTTRAFAERNPEVIRAIVRARMRAVDFIRENPAAAAEIAAKVWERPKEVMERVVRDLVAGNFWSQGEIELDGLKSYTEHLRITETIPATAEVDWKGLVDQRYLPETLRRSW
jgi:NitT/TauT family transport system substrate-binding protein